VQSITQAYLSLKQEKKQKLYKLQKQNKQKRGNNEIQTNL